MTDHNPLREALEPLFVAAIAEAEKAIRKFPQPNYVISKVAEEAGEVVKAAIHCAEGRETAENVVGEIRQTLAMLIRLYVEGDQVHGLAPLAPLAALAAAPQPAPVFDGDEASKAEMNCQCDRLDPKEPAPSDREALVEVIGRTLTSIWLAQNVSPSDASIIADDLLARGLRLPGVVANEPASGDTQAPLPITGDTQAAPETLAWAAIGPDGKAEVDAVHYRREIVERDLRDGERIVRVAIRVVEGGDNA